MLSLSRACSVQQGGQYRIGNGEPADLVGHQGGDQFRIAPLASEGVGDPRSGLDHVVIGGGVGGGGVRRIPLGLAEDDVMTDGGEVLVGETQPTQCSGAQVGDHHIDRGGNGQGLGPTDRVLQVEGDVALVAQQVEGDTGQLRHGSRGHDSNQRPLRVLHGDHVGTQITHDLGGQWTHDHRTQVDHTHAVERTRGRRGHRGSLGAVAGIVPARVVAHGSDAGPCPR